jgi:hypothetical protein
MRIRLLSGLVAAAMLAIGAGAQAADRAVAWVTVDGAFERDLNRAAARGLRLAAISDGLPCGVAAMQAPEAATSAATYRVVAYRDLAATLPDLLAGGFVPRLATRIVGTRHAVVFERTTPPMPPVAWRLVEFEKLEDLGAALAAVAAEGVRPRVLVRPPFRSWPGLSERGMVLAAGAERAAAVESRVLVGSNRDLKDVAPPLTAATAVGWTVDLLFSSARDGSDRLRRERLVVAMSRPAGTTSGAAVSIERHTSFGLFGAGVIAGAAAFWNDYLTAWTPRDRRQIWASPIQLSNTEASCAGLEFKLRLDGMDDQAHDIVALLGKPRTTGGHELVVVTEQRLGF